MRVRINAAGRLEIERAGKWALQYCPYSGDEEAECGDWCPLFNEPEGGLLQLCQTMFDEEDVIIDERG